MEEDHHVWPKKYRSGGDVIRKRAVKRVSTIQHDIWNKFSNGDHPAKTFTRIIKLCTGKIKASDEETKDLILLSGISWKDHPSDAIVEIFYNFMPDELGAMIIPYLNGAN